MSHIMSKVHVYVANVGFPQPPSNTRHGMKSSRRRTPPALLLTSLYGLEKQELTLTFHSSCTLETRELFLPLISFYGGDSRPLRLLYVPLLLQQLFCTLALPGRKLSAPSCPGGQSDGWTSERFSHGIPHAVPFFSC